MARVRVLFILNDVGDSVQFQVYNITSTTIQWFVGVQRRQTTWEKKKKNPENSNCFMPLWTSCYVYHAIRVVVPSPTRTSCATKPSLFFPKSCQYKPWIFRGHPSLVLSPRLRWLLALRKSARKRRKRKELKANASHTAPVYKFQPFRIFFAVVFFPLKFLKK